VRGLEAHVEHAGAQVERSLAMATALAPAIGYERAAEIAKEAHESGRTVREIASERGVLEPAELERVLDPRRQASPARR
jgi:fumarate hydratase class II